MVYQWRQRESNIAQIESVDYLPNIFLFQWDCIYKYYPELKKNFKKGHFLGQHSWAHPDMTTLSWEQAHDELWRVEKAFIQMFGARVSRAALICTTPNMQVSD